MDDLISRQAAIELCDWYQHEFCECDYAFGELANELHKLPSAQQWIPCSERLPNLAYKHTDCESFVIDEDGSVKAVDAYDAYESNDVLITGDCVDYGNRLHGVFTAKYYSWKYEDGKEEAYWADNQMGELTLENVEAWMPLPEPYKGDTA